MIRCFCRGGGISNARNGGNNFPGSIRRIIAIHLILNNAGSHKSEDFLKFIATTKIKIRYLPPYSPNLNPIERVWKIMHENTTYNRYYAKLSEFTENILGFFENIGNYKAILQGRINDNFQRLTLA